jgi:hypothetical protein
MAGRKEELRARRACFVIDKTAKSSDLWRLELKGPRGGSVMSSLLLQDHFIHRPGQARPRNWVIESATSIAPSKMAQRSLGKVRRRVTLILRVLDVMTHHDRELSASRTTVLAVPGDVWMCHPPRVRSPLISAPFRRAVGSERRATSGTLA